MTQSQVAAEDTSGQQHSEGKAVRVGGRSSAEDVEQNVKGSQKPAEDGRMKGGPHKFCVPPIFGISECDFCGKRVSVM